MIRLAIGLLRSAPALLRWHSAINESSTFTFAGYLPPRHFGTGFAAEGTMKDSLRHKLGMLAEKQHELNARLSDPQVIQNMDLFRELSIELADISQVVAKYEHHTALEREIQEATVMLEDDDPQIQELAQSELAQLKQQLETALEDLHHLLLPKDPNDSRNIYLEIRAGTGGDEAALFAGDLLRMYKLYVQSRGWKGDIVSASEGEYGGYNKVIVRVVGRGAYSRLKFESGAHRVQRVPKTEAQGRIHTSACTVAILPEADKIDDVQINPQDLRVDTFRASGAGGQHVNRTDSAVRITHFPTGIVVECQDERSQHQNRARAMAMLRARMLEQEIRNQQEQRSAARKLMVGSGDRSERIRTYNYPQGRVTDHRINLTLYKLEEIMAGTLDSIVEPLITEFQAAQMADIESSDQ